MTKIPVFLLKTFVFLFCVQLHATENTRNNSELEAFQKGLQLYKEKKYSESSKVFDDLLKTQPLHSGLLTNAALSHFYSGEKFLALAYSRKAFGLDPELSTVSSTLDYLTHNIEIPDVPHEILIYEQIRGIAITPFSSSLFLLVLSISSLGTGWGLISYWAQRKRAQETQDSPPVRPKSVWWLMSFVFILSLFGTLTKMWDERTVRGTLIQDVVKVRSAPEEGAPEIFELRGGLEVVVDHFQTTEKGEWMQVTYPGSKTGWIPKETLFITQGL